MSTARTVKAFFRQAWPELLGHSLGFVVKWVAVGALVSLGWHWVARV